MNIFAGYQKIVKKWREERRLPARITSHPALLLPLYVYLKLVFIINSFFKPARISCVVAFPIVQNRYGTYLLFALQQTYSHILVVWDLTLRDLQLLFPEGRRIFTMQGVYFTNKQRFSRFSLRTGTFDFVRATDGPQAPPGAARIFDIDKNLALPAVENSYLFPYGPHPNNFPLQAKRPTASPLKLEQRSIRVFFSGTNHTNPSHDSLLVERNFHVPCRQTTIIELKRSYPTAIWIDDMVKRKHFDNGGYGSQIPLCIATVKGNPSQWLTELCQADFFICLPGSHMLMCHNAVEAISMGCIPILCYENWFSPNLVHGVNCLSYRDLNGLKRAIDTALAISQEEISALRSNVLDYHKQHLDCIEAAKRVFGRNHPYRRLTVYMNQEDCDNYTAALPNSVLLEGGTLQSTLTRTRDCD